MRVPMRPVVCTYHEAPILLLRRTPARAENLHRPCSELTAKPIPRWLGVLLMLCIAITFGSNHIAARIALDHGANVMTAVLFR